MMNPSHISFVLTRFTIRSKPKTKNIPRRFGESMKWKKFFAFAAGFFIFCKLAIGLTASHFRNVMMDKMIPHRQNFKIFKAIVQFISIFMMHHFMALKNAPKMFLHNMTMLKDWFFTHINNFIPSFYLARSFWTYFSKSRISILIPTLIMFSAPFIANALNLAIFDSTFHKEHYVLTQEKNQEVRHELY